MSHDPYAPSPRRRPAAAPPDGTLPVGRLRSAGASLALVTALATVWVFLGEQERLWQAQQMAVRDDEEMAAWVASLAPPVGSIPVLLGWVDGHDSPALAAAVAAAEERGRPRPRPRLLDALAQRWTP